MFAVCVFKTSIVNSPSVTRGAFYDGCCCAYFLVIGRVAKWILKSATNQSPRLLFCYVERKLG